MQLWVYVVRRLLLLVPVLLGVMTITFALISALPIEEQLVAYGGSTHSPCGYAPTCPAGVNGCPPHGPACPNPARAREIQQLGLDQPLVVRWARYMYNSLTLNLGFTDAHSEVSTLLLGGTSVPIAQVLGWYLPYTLELAALSLTIILLLAIPIGNYAAVYRNRPFDQGARILSFSGFAFPGFLLAILLLYGATAFLSGGLGTTFCGHESSAYDQWYGSWPDQVCMSGGVYPSWIGQHLATSPTGFPTVDALLHAIAAGPGPQGQQDWFLAADSIRRMIVPAVVIAFGSIAGILRFVRNSMLEVMNLDFIRTARAKGVAESRVIAYHAGRNSLNVTVTVLGLTFAGFIAGFPVVEEVFHLNGVGLLLVESIQAPPDFGLIFATTLLFTIIVVLANLVVDVVYAILDPRVRLG